MRLLIFLAFLAVPSWAAPPVSGQRPVPQGSVMGSARKTVAAAGADSGWTNYTSASFRCANTGAACAANLTFYSITIRSRDTADTVYLQAKAGNNEAVTDAPSCEPMDVLADLDLSGMDTKTISLRAADGAADVEIIAYFYPN